MGNRPVVQFVHLSAPNGAFFNLCYSSLHIAQTYCNSNKRNRNDWEMLSKNMHNTTAPFKEKIFDILSGISHVAISFIAH